MRRLPFNRLLKFCSTTEVRTPLAISIGGYKNDQVHKTGLLTNSKPQITGKSV